MSKKYPSKKAVNSSLPPFFNTLRPKATFPTIQLQTDDQKPKSIGKMIQMNGLCGISFQDVASILFLTALPVYAQAGSDPWDNAVNVLKTAFLPARLPPAYHWSPSSSVD
jgi:hypothetical protein